MKLIEIVKSKLMEILNITPATSKPLTVREELTHSNHVLMHRILYRGSNYEIEQFFKCIAGNTATSVSRFWAATSKSHVRKIHSGIYAKVVDFYAQAIATDYDGISVEENDDSELLEAILKDNDIRQLIGDTISEALITGDGAYKISIDKSISKYPIVEFYPADRVEYKFIRGRVREVIFITEVTENNKKYKLCEQYGIGYVKYTLYDKKGVEVDIHSIEATKELVDVKFAGSFMMAVPVRFFKSTMYKGRGKALFDSKIEDIDALDEVISQWIDAVRDGRTQKYFPENLLPRDTITGEVMTPNDFDNRFIAIKSQTSETIAEVIQTVQPAINYEAYQNSYINFLDLVLQGIISPCSLGIDTKRTDNAEAQREKEKTTLFMRGIIVDVLTDDLKLLCDTLLKVYANMYKGRVKDTDISIKFGEYAAPDFNSKLEAIGNAYQKGVISTEKAVDELYGDSMTVDEKLEEVERIKSAGSDELPEPPLVG